MSRRTTCDCRRDDCGGGHGLELTGQNAGQDPVVVRFASGLQLEIKALPGADGQLPDLRVACVLRLLKDGEPQVIPQLAEQQVEGVLLLTAGGPR